MAEDSNSHEQGLRQASTGAISRGQEQDDFTEQLLGHVFSLEKLLGLPTGFFLHLLKEGDDWSFIIKTHALIESGMTRLLEAATTPSIPAEFLQTLPLSGRHSKLELLRLLGHADSDDAKFVSGLSRIRNLLVHNVTHVRFVLTEYLATLSARDAQSLVTGVCCVFYNESWPKSDAKRQKQLAAILAEPKFFVWRTALLCLAMTSLRLDNLRLKTETEKLTREKLIAEADLAKRITKGLAGDFSGLNAYKQMLRRRGDAPSEAGAQTIETHEQASDFKEP